MRYIDGLIGEIWLNGWDNLEVWLSRNNHSFFRNQVKYLPKQGKDMRMVITEYLVSGLVLIDHSGFGDGQKGVEEELEGKIHAARLRYFEAETAIIWDSSAVRTYTKNGLIRCLVR